MTPEELEILILEARDSAAVQIALSSLTDKERKSLSTSARKLRSQISQNKVDKDASERLKKHLAKSKDGYYSSSTLQKANLGLFALCPPSALKRRDLFIHWDEHDAFQQAILDRKPDWLDDWLSWDLQQEFRITSFPMLRNWMKAGICSKPAVDGYYRMFANHLMRFGDRRDKTPQLPLSEQLVAEPDMLQDVWRLFEIENDAFGNDGWIPPNTPDNYETWSDALVKLSAAGHLDRSRLLDASLSALKLDVKQPQLSGYHKFHKQLKPSKSELLERQQIYLDLLCHRVGHVVRFALSMLSKIEKEPDFDADRFLREAQAVFQQEAKGNSVSALKLIARVGKRHTSLLEMAIETTIKALKHSNLDVQNQALDFLTTHAAHIASSGKSELAQLADYTAESIKETVLRLSLETDSTTLQSTEDADTGSTGESNRSQSDAQSTPPDGADGTTPTTITYQPISPDILQQKILPSLSPIEPIADIDELITTLSHAVETVDSPDEVERIIDGISRFCADKPDDFDARVSPLLHRIRVGGGLATSNGIAGTGGCRLSLTDLILSWLTGEKIRTGYSPYFAITDALEPAIRRIAEVTERVYKQQPQALIGAPTHSGGWIDPVIWMQRIIESENRSLPFDRSDLCFSFLRLTPDNRDMAIQQLHLLSDRMRPLVEFALGGDAEPDYDDRNNYDLWISAARGRDPYRDWSEFFSPMQLRDLWPDSLRPGKLTWRAYLKQHQSVQKYSATKEVYEWVTPQLDIDVITDSESNETQKPKGIFDKLTQALDNKLATKWKWLPSAALSHQSPKDKRYWQSDLHTSWVTNWLTYQWPLCPDGAYVTGVRQLVERIDMDSSSWEPGFGFFYGLFQEGRPWRESGHLLLCLGLIGKDADTRAFSIDALITGVEQNLADHALFSDTLSHLSNGGWLKLNRLGDNLMQISQVSTLHAWFVSNSIQRWLQSVDIKQRSMFRMLEVLLESQSVIKQPLSDDTIKVLKEIKGSSKASKLSSKLLIL